MKKLSTLNSQFSTPRGFTLIELLVGASIFVTISVVIVGILFASFRAGRKSELLLNLKQSGDAVLLQMVNNIRYAKSLNDPISCIAPVTQTSITVTSASDNGVTIYSCPDPVKMTTTIASNGASLIDQSAVIVSSCSFTCSQSSIDIPPTITINFTLNVANSSGLVETTGTQSFQTAVTMRNYAK